MILFTAQITDFVCQCADLIKQGRGQTVQRQTFTVFLFFLLLFFLFLYGNFFTAGNNFSIIVVFGIVAENFSADIGGLNNRSSRRCVYFFIRQGPQRLSPGNRRNMVIFRHSLRRRSRIDNGMSLQKFQVFFLHFFDGCNNRLCRKLLAFFQSQRNDR